MGLCRNFTKFKIIHQVSYFRRCFAYLHGAIAKLLNNARPIVQKRKFCGENIENYLAASKSTNLNFLRFVQRRKRSKYQSCPLIENCTRSSPASVDALLLLTFLQAT